jgi:hypothetical protein
MYSMENIYSSIVVEDDVVVFCGGYLYRFLLLVFILRGIENTDPLGVSWCAEICLKGVCYRSAQCSVYHVYLERFLP